MEFTYSDVSWVNGCRRKVWLAVVRTEGIRAARFFVGGLMQNAMNRRSFVAGAAGAAVLASFGVASAQADEGGLNAELIKSGSWSFEVAPEPVPED